MEATETTPTTEATTDAAGTPTPPGELHQRVAAIIEQEIRPALAMDGGDIELIGIEGDTAVVRLQGHCVGCPGAAMTLQFGVQQMISRSIPEIRNIRQG